jgi:hypothetical protein
MKEELIVRTLKDVGRLPEVLVVPFGVQQLSGSTGGDLVGILTVDGRLFALDPTRPQDLRIVPFPSQSVYPLRSVLVSPGGQRIAAVDCASRLWVEECGKELHCVSDIGKAVRALVSDSHAALLDDEGILWVGKGCERLRVIFPKDKRRFSAIGLSGTHLLAITKISGILCRFNLTGEEDLHFKNIVVPACNDDRSAVQIVSIPGSNGDDFIIWNETSHRLFWLRLGLESPWTKEIELPSGFHFDSVMTSIFDMYLMSPEGHVYSIQWDHLNDEWLNVWPGAPKLAESDLRHYSATSAHAVLIAAVHQDNKTTKDELLDLVNQINLVRRETLEFKTKVKDLRVTTTLPPLPSQKYLLRDALRRKVNEAKALEEHAESVERVSAQIHELQNTSAAAREFKITLDEQTEADKGCAARLENSIKSLLHQRDTLKASIALLRPKLQLLHDELQIIMQSSSQETRELQLAKIHEAIAEISSEIETKRRVGQDLEEERNVAFDAIKSRQETQRALVNQWTQIRP